MVQALTKTKRHARRYVETPVHEADVQPLRAAGYTRLSDNFTGEKDATERQDIEIQAHHARMGWLSLPTYQDDDRSAWKKSVVRESFQRVLNDIAAGEIDVLTVWKSDRLARQPRDLERLLDVIEEANKHRAEPIRLVSVTEPIDFGSPMGIMVLRMFISWANWESTTKSLRLQSKLKSQARKGKFFPGGRQQYGYKRDGTVDDEPAVLINEAVYRILDAGEAIYSITNSWNARGERTQAGNAWKNENLRRSLRSPRLAGYIVHKGEIQYHVETDDHLCVICRTAWPCKEANEPAYGGWEPLIAPDRWWALQDVLDERSSPRKKSVKRHLLSGFLMCDCGAPCGGEPYWQNGKRTDVHLYKCTGCRRVSVNGGKLDAEVFEQLVYVVTSDAFNEMRNAALAKDGDSDVNQLRASLYSDRETLEQLASDHYTAKIIPRDIFVRESQALNERIERTSKQLERRSTSPLKSIPTSEPEIRAAWEHQPMVWRRALVEAVIVGMTLKPGGRGSNQRPVSERVDIEWRA